MMIPFWFLSDDHIWSPFTQLDRAIMKAAHNWAYKRENNTAHLYESIQKAKVFVSFRSVSWNKISYKVIFKHFVDL
jgi:hypothetical protein